MKSYVKLTIEDYKMGRDKQYPTEWTADIEKAAQDLLNRINGLLIDLKWDKDVKISSGWRPSAINSGVAGAAKKSSHMTGQACDLLDDKDQTLGKSITIELLTKWGLYMESLDHTKGKYSNWTHIQTRPTKNRVFIP